MTNFACQDKSEIDKKNRYFPSFAIEMTFINKKLITIKNNTRSYKLHPLNHPNSN